MRPKLRLKERRGALGISLAVALLMTLATGSPVAAAPTPLIDVLVVEASDNSTFRTNQLANKFVPSAGTSIAGTGQFALTPMGQTGLAALTCSQIQAFDVVYVPILFGGEPSRNAIKNNPAFPQCFASNERAVVTGYHAEDHGQPATGQFLYDAMVWIDGGTQVGLLVLNDIAPSPVKYDFLQPMFPGVYASVQNQVTAFDNITFLTTPAHPIHANTSDGVQNVGQPTMDNWGQTCHTVWNTFGPGGGGYEDDSFIAVSQANFFSQPGGPVCALAKEGGPGPPANLTLSPPTDTNTAGEEHCVTATVTDANGNPTPGITVRFSVSGANSASGSATTDANGQAQFCYTGTVAGTDTISAYADTNNDGVQDPGEPGDTAEKIYEAGPPATLTLEPKTATNTVDSQHCVTATVKDAFGNPTPGITVRFSVSGSVTTGGSAVTDANGQATFCYQGPALPGSDTITAYADTDNDGVQDANEPSDTATKEWVLPASTAGCKVTYGGRITAANGDKATFGGNAQVPASGPKGQEEYQDHGPAQPRNVHSINVQAVVCSADKTQASIFGQATIDGAGTFDYRIDLEDLSEPGTSDTYRIRLSDGYDSGKQTLKSGNVQIHK